MSNKINKREIKINWIENPPKIPNGEKPASTGIFFLLIGVHIKVCLRSKRIPPTKNTNRRKITSKMTSLSLY